jgi:hypothetical protein
VTRLAPQNGESGGSCRSTLVLALAPVLIELIPAIASGVAKTDGFGKLPGATVGVDTKLLSLQAVAVCSPSANRSLRRFFVKRRLTA